MSSISDSILESVKRVLGLESTEHVFDQDVIMHVNTTLSVLTQLGIGPVDGFMIVDDTQTWADFLHDVKPLNMVQTFVYLKVRIVFDPPTTGYLMAAMEKQIEELTWRINVYRESLIPILVPEVDDV